MWMIRMGSRRRVVVVVSCHVGQARKVEKADEEL